MIANNCFKKYKADLADGGQLAAVECMLSKLPMTVSVEQQFKEKSEQTEGLDL